MKSQLKKIAPLTPATSTKANSAVEEMSRIAAAINRILLINRGRAEGATGSLADSATTPEPVADSAPQTRPSAQTPKRLRDATAVEWALRMMF